jgi:hypothetical protein
VAVSETLAGVPVHSRLVIQERFRIRLEVVVVTMGVAALSSRRATAAAAESAPG